MSGSIIRVKKDDRYFVAANEPFNDKQLTWEARGLLGYLLSKPNDWETYNRNLINSGPAGEHKVKRIVKELQDAGYMRRFRIRNDDGTFDWITEVYESPSLNPDYDKSTPQSSTSGSSTGGSSTSGKPHRTLSTDVGSTDVQKTEGKNMSSADDVQQLSLDGSAQTPKEVVHKQRQALIGALSQIVYGKPAQSLSKGARMGVVKIANRLLEQERYVYHVQIFERWWRSWADGRPSKPSIVLDKIEEALEWYESRPDDMPRERNAVSPDQTGDLRERDTV